MASSFKPKVPKPPPAPLSVTQIGAKSARAAGPIEAPRPPIPYKATPEELAEQRRVEELKKKQEAEAERKREEADKKRKAEEERRALQKWQEAQPENLDKFHWGAFLLNFVWALPNGVWSGLLCLVPGPCFIMPFVLGKWGYRWAWSKPRWEDKHHFARVQRAWTNAGAGLTTLAMLAVIGWFGFHDLYPRVIQLVEFREEEVVAETIREQRAAARRDAALAKERRTTMPDLYYDGQSAVSALAKSALQCAKRDGQLPANSHPVPREWFGNEYESTASDWQDPIFLCGRFHLDKPQKYRYQWIRVDALNGMAVGDTDFDEKGAPGRRVQIRVFCRVPTDCDVEELPEPKLDVQQDEQEAQAP